MVLIIFLALYVTCSSYLQPIVRGIQGRYFTPVLLCLVPAFAGPTPTAVKAGKAASFSLAVANQGNDTASGPLSITVAALPSSSSGAEPATLATTAKRINIKPAGSKKLKLTFKAPASLAAGTYLLVVTVNDNNSIAEPNTSNNTVFADTPFTAS